jgi:hypothetical protein
MIPATVHRRPPLATHLPLLRSGEQRWKPVNQFRQDDTAFAFWRDVRTDVKRTLRRSGNGRSGAFGVGFGFLTAGMINSIIRHDDET